jgi:tRNA-splicing endonuclease subunit Sen34
MELMQVIKALREQYNIVGTPVGTLLQLPTQNIFLGAPVEYSPEEVALLGSKNAITVLDGKISGRKSRKKPRQQHKSSPYGIFLEFPKDRRRQGKLLQDPAEQDLPESTSRVLSTRLPSTDSISFKVYEYLHNAGYWMTPGLRFGCDFTAYPGDPLRYHSHFMVHVEKEDKEVDMLTLVAGGRVATQTRKAWMLAGQVDGEIRVFSIEWAGFG